MNKYWFKTFMVLALVSSAFGIASAQGGAKQGPDVNRDPDMETESKHNLEVARQYFKLRKAYVASLQRCEEVLAANPAYSKIDEILYIAGKSSLNLAEGKGKQKPDQYVIHDGDKKVTLTPDEFRDKARDYLSQLVNSYPQSTFRTEAEDDLKALGGAKPKESKP
ncbi:MAG TPA: outer membrane protein assembly factor BamD [Pyrinomonadaceae bacterium]|nr:outer membrane protein assembly factor BamD [Pyrinomonadaceae bacterium]